MLSDGRESSLKDLPIPENVPFTLNLLDSIGRRVRSASNNGEIFLRWFSTRTKEHCKDSGRRSRNGTGSPWGRR